MARSLNCRLILNLGYFSVELKELIFVYLSLDIGRQGRIQGCDYW